MGLANGNAHWRMGMPIHMGFTWDSHENGSSSGLLIGMGIVLIGIAYLIGEK